MWHRQIRLSLGAGFTGLFLLSTGWAAEIVGGGESASAYLYNGSALRPGYFSTGGDLDDFAYTALNSGAGKAAFLTNNPQATAGLFLADRAGTAWPAGTSVDYAGSDSVLSADELAAYNATYNNSNVPSTHYYGPLIQIPVAGTGVAIPFNQSGGALNLSFDRICGIFSGRITTWSEVRTGVHPPPGTLGDLTVVYQDEPSGTTELLTRFLTSVCTMSDPGVFAPTVTFSDLPGFNGEMPSGFIGVKTGVVTGSEAMSAKVNNTVGAIGYVSPSFVPPTEITAPDPLLDATKVAQINGVPPAVAYMALALGTAAPPTTNLTDPRAWVYRFENVPAVGYPIVGFSTLEIGQCYVDYDVADRIRAFIIALTDSSPLPLSHRFIPLSSAYRQLIRNTFVDGDGAVSLGLDINNPDVCGSGASRMGRPANP